MSTVKTGWLKNNDGEKFAPKTLMSQVMTNEGITLESQLSVELDATLAEAKEYTDNAVSAKADSNHSHDDRYYTEAEIESKLSKKSETTHNHDDKYEEKGAAESAVSDAMDIFDAALKSMYGEEDYDGEGLPPTIRAIAQSEVAPVDEKIDTHIADNGIHVSFDNSSTKPKMDGTANVGTSSKVARADHVHPTDNTRVALSDFSNHVDDATHINSGERTNWNTAYTHSQTQHARVDATKVEDSTTNGNIKINGVETNVYTHPTGTNPHGTTKEDVGLGNVDNTSDKNKPVSNAQAAAIKVVQDDVDLLEDEFDDHTANSGIHFSPEERTKLAGIASGANKYTHPNSGVSAGTYRSVTVDAQGHVTSGTNPTTLEEYGITDAYTTTELDSMFDDANKYTDDKIAKLIGSAPETLDTLGEIAAAMETNQGVVEALDNAIGSKANASDLTDHTNNKNNPHGVTKSQLGLSNVENKSSATIRGEITKENVTNALGYTPPTENTTYSAATSSVLGLVKSGGDITVGSDGVMSVKDDSHNHTIANIDELQTKLDSIDNSLNNKSNSDHGHAISEITNLQNTLNGKADSEHGTHVTYSTTAPVMDGTASAGSASTVARSDHKHPTDTSRASKTEFDQLVATVDGKANAEHDHEISDVAELQTALDSKAAAGHTHIYYGVCSSGATTSAKTVTIPDFTLKTGAMIIVKFTNANSVGIPTLNVSGTGAKPICVYGNVSVGTDSTSNGWSAGAVQMFVYDGTNWIRDYWNTKTYSNASLGSGYATCSTAAETTAKVASLTNYALTTGGIVSIKFSNDVPAGATLNVNSKGAKAIYHKGASITSGVIKAGDIATFIYSTYYHLIAIDRDSYPKDQTYSSTQIDDKLADMAIMDVEDNTSVEIVEDSSNVAVSFSEPATKSLPVSGETLSTLMGKTTKYLRSHENDIYYDKGETYTSSPVTLTLNENVKVGDVINVYVGSDGASVSKTQVSTNNEPDDSGMTMLPMIEVETFAPELSGDATPRHETITVTGEYSSYAITDAISVAVNDGENKNIKDLKAEVDELSAKSHKVGSISSNYTSLLDWCLDNPHASAVYTGLGFEDSPIGTNWGNVTTLSPKADAGITVLVTRNYDNTMFFRKIKYTGEWAGNDWINLDQLNADIKKINPNSGQLQSAPDGTAGRVSMFTYGNGGYLDFDTNDEFSYRLVLGGNGLFIYKYENGTIISSKEVARF